MLTFEEKEHIYRWNGRKAPSVTQILNQWIKVSYGREFYINTIDGTAVDAETFEAAQDFGTAVHLACKYLLLGGLDWDTLDPALVGPLKQFGQWIEDYRITPILVEQPLFSEKHFFAGTPDIICESGRLKGLLLPDIKTPLKNVLVGPQTAAYEMLYREYSKSRESIKRYELTLPKDGSEYGFRHLTGINDLAFFLSKRFQHSFFNS